MDISYPNSVFVFFKVFKVKRNGQGEKKKGRKQTKYEGLHNRKLLWHGSRVTNYAGILSQVFLITELGLKFHTI